MTPSIADVLASLQRDPPRLYLVGGPVRDRLMGRAWHDWDLACRGARAIAKEAARQTRGHWIVLDEEYQIFRVVVPQPSGPQVTLDFAELQGKSIEEDLGRRDFTVNAMASPVGSDRVIDPFRGTRDLKGRQIRVVSAKAFEEDPLRLLRAFRFAAQLDFRIEPRTAALLKRFSPRFHMAGLGGSPGALKQVAAERVREELLRLFSQRQVGPHLVAMDKAGLLRRLFPEMEACRRTALSYYGAGGVLKHSLQTVEHLDWILRELSEGKQWAAMWKSRTIVDGLRAYTEKPVGGFPMAAWMRWGGFLHDIGKPATAKRIGGRLRFFGHDEVGAGQAREVVGRFRCSRQESFQIAGWVRHHMRPGNLAAGAAGLTPKAAARFFRDLGDDGVGMVLVSLADHYGYLAKREWGRGRDRVERVSIQLLTNYFVQREKVLPKRLIDGHQLMKSLNLKPGPIIGKLLEAVQDAQAEGKVKTVEEALRWAKKATAAVARSLARQSPNPKA